MKGARLTPNEYMALLQRRLDDWRAASPGSDPRFPPLLSWFVREGDEDLVDIPAEPKKPKPKPPASPRRHRPAADIAAEIERTQARMGGLGRPLSDDPASARLGDARLLRRHGARMDRDLEEYTQLSQSLKLLQHALAGAKAREATAATDPKENWDRGEL